MGSEGVIIMRKLCSEIKKAGQPYVDEPIYILPKKEGAISRSVRAAFGDQTTVNPLLVGHERVKLRWMTPDGKGGLIPKAKG